MAVLLIFFLVPETAGASVRKEHGKLNYMSLEELNYIFGVPTSEHIQYQIQHVLPWAAKMIMYRSARLLGREVEKPFLEKMYYWVAVKNDDNGGIKGEDTQSTEAKEVQQEHREVALGRE